MRIRQDVETGFWTVGLRNVHPETACEGRLCDIHNRRGEEPWASWPLNWRIDRHMMEMVCPCGVGHPTPAQVGYWLLTKTWVRTYYEGVHGCCGCCAGSTEQLREEK